MGDVKTERFKSNNVCGLTIDPPHRKRPKKCF